MNMKIPNCYKPKVLDLWDEIYELDDEVRYTNTLPRWLSADEADYRNSPLTIVLESDGADGGGHHLSPLTIIFESEKTQEELMDMVQHLVKEHPELIPSAKELLEALHCACDANKHAQKAMELLKNQHVCEGLVKTFAEGYAVHRTVNMLAEKVLECRTVANRVARIRRDPLLGKCVSAKGDVDIMRGALCILVGYWIDRRLERWLTKKAFNLIASNSQQFTNPPLCEISDLNDEVPYTNTGPSGLVHNKLSVDEADRIFSPLTIILEREKIQEELIDMVQPLVKEHPELISSAKELLEALECDENKHAEKAMELLKNQHVREGLVKTFAEGYAVYRTVNMLAENVLECRTVANRVARIKRDPLLDKCVSAKGDVDIMRGALCILLGYWIDRRMERWLNERAFKLIPPNSQQYTNPPPPPY